MTPVRSLQVAVAVLCLCLPLAAVAQDPTVGCQVPYGDSTYGVTTPSDSGWYHIVGLNFYASATYNILCSYRALYRKGPGGLVDTYGPWHGNPKEDLADCTGPYSSIYTNTSDWAEAGNGNYGTRINAANGQTVIVNFSIGRHCVFPQPICAGVGCPGSGNYESEIASLRADPTYRTYNFTAPSFVPAGQIQVITMLNATATTDVAIQAPSGVQRVMSSITSVAYCYGYQTLLC